MLFAMPFGAFCQKVDSLEASLPLPGGLTAVPVFGQMELVLFNTMATYRTELPAGAPYPFGRGNTLESIFQAQIGLSRRNRWSAGFDVYQSNYRYGFDDTTPAFAPFGGAPANGVAAHGISQAGVKGRFVPVASLPQLTVQARVLFPTLPADDAARTLLGYDRTSAQLQISFLQLIAPRLYGYAQVEWGAQFQNDTRKQTTWNLPVQLFVLYRVLRSGERSVSAFAGIGQTTFFEKQYKGGLKQSNFGRYWAAGAQWQINKTWGLSAAYQGALAFDDATPILRSSFHALNLNLRYVGKIF